MIYQGNKARIRKYILPVLQKCIDENQVKTYVEPFVGGANIIDHIVCSERIGTDINRELIALLQYMQLDPELKIFPERCPVEHYKEVRENRKHNGSLFNPAYTAGIGYFASYGGRYFDGGYARDAKGNRIIYAERLAYARKQAPLLKNICFDVRDYRFYINYVNCVFYLDPPYKGTKVYNSVTGFDYDKFYSFCRDLSKNNWVFISEYEMPDDFECIWSKERKVFQKSDRANAEVATEKLFVYKEGRR